MARALVVYESMFGNTKAIAEAIGEALAAEVVEVSDAPDVLPDDVGLLVVGAPTHAFGLSRPATRKSAADQAAGDRVSTGRGVREWLDALAPLGHHVTAHAFDTRIGTGRLPGSAAKAIARRLRALHCAVPGKPVSFHVGGTPGPLLVGEPTRAAAWARSMLVGNQA
ncbi:flavodoxin family protein [Saccharothrix algeriensis]|uniref:Flavodoxin family protein n=1 Tax=Saccharothrix algeriensis TaxID=173560 RepID=A0A8T8I208_9PSEU|nr:flavodoxin domain-containing protein [Saccharothrix algeriensis]MBM7809728.1 NAD(P)H dehydrogenase (quinone) [Saccharothrix algeriensis]QTR04014.1 flavodoxin family protein [Saccharothrix algeriensis]